MAGKKRAFSDDTELESKGEMDNFQDLMLGSMMPVVRHEGRFVLTFSHLTTPLQDMNKLFAF